MNSARSSLTVYEGTGPFSPQPPTDAYVRPMTNHLNKRLDRMLIGLRSVSFMTVLFPIVR